LKDAAEHKWKIFSDLKEKILFLLSLSLSPYMFSLQGKKLLFLPSKKSPLSLKELGVC
jgi:hypothetical protein